MSNHTVIEWLLEGDASIRWQVLRDLLDADDLTVAQERAKVATEGWGARLLALQDGSGRWGGQLYGNKWLSTTYTLLLLRRMGLEPANPQAGTACQSLLEAGFQENGGICYAKTVNTIDNGVTGMILSLLAYFRLPDDRLHAVAEHLLGQQEQDGRWEPFPDNRQIRYVFDGTMLILEGLWEYESQYPGRAKISEARMRGEAFLLRHNLYKYPHTGEVIDIKMTRFSFPPRWHYDLLVGLDHFQTVGAEKEARLGDAIDVLRSRQDKTGRWPLQNRHPGKTFFEMEEVGKPSRWNTLRALRVLKWWDGG